MAHLKNQQFSLLMLRIYVFWIYFFLEATVN